MNIYNLDTWRDYRKQFSQGNLTTAKSRRGIHHYAPPAIVKSDTIEVIEMSDTLRRIVDAETDLIYNGTIRDQATIDRLYHNDEHLLHCYKQLRVYRLHGNSTSRNNIICVLGCCLSTWHFYGDELIVYSRSMDIRAAGLSDPYTVNEIALTLNAKRWTLIVAHPHIYDDTTKVARRS